MRILVLSTWFPYPPSQGSKLRAYYLIKALSVHHEIALVSFQDCDIAAEHLAHMRTICSRVEIVEDAPFAKHWLKLFIGFFTPVPSSIVSGFSRKMKNKVQELVEEWNPDVLCGFQIYAAQYLQGFLNKIRIADIDNVMARYLRDIYNQTQSRGARFRRWFAWYKFLKYEQAVYRRFDSCFVSSKQEKEEALQALKIPANKIYVISNGVDTTIKYPGIRTPEPYTLIFNGALTFGANYDAMTYFLQEIFPKIQEQIPEVQLKITGSTKGVQTDWISGMKNVTLTGFLDDVCPTIAASYACVVPLRLGVGTRLKILELMALGTPVITTTKGAEGLDVKHGHHLLIADDPDEFSRQTVRLLRDPDLRQHLTTAAASLVQERYSWDRIGQDVQQIFHDLQ